MPNIVTKQHLTQFSQSDLDRIRISTFVEQVDYHHEIASTNDRAMKLAVEPDLIMPALVLAEFQTNGRGRGTNQWWSQSGALTFSLLVETDAWRLPLRRWPQASLTIGLAICEALESLSEDSVFQLKWPNDVYFNQRKVCGILIEVPPARKGVMVIGVGINVNNSVQRGPAELHSSAIALCDATARDLGLIDVLLPALTHIRDRLGWIGHRDEELRTKWRERCMLTGRRISLDSGMRSVTGVCHGIDNDGALLVTTANGTQRCLAGTITVFE
jgi:BirA family biotin operon repressor/biotin-[acetyl-CoA-carboxylase] ligase